jgi:hypothetical protein
MIPFGMFFFLLTLSAFKKKRRMPGPRNREFKNLSVSDNASISGSIAGPAGETISGSRVLTRADSGKTFQVSNETGGDTVITLPNEPSAGLTFRFVRAGPVIHQIGIVAASGQAFTGRFHTGPSAIVSAGTAGIQFDAGNGIAGDYLEFHSVGDSGAYFVKGTASNANALISFSP